jgi:hypothetical protein
MTLQLSQIYSTAESKSEILRHKKMAESIHKFNFVIKENLAQK